MTKRLIASAVLAASALLLTAGAALAVPVYVTQNANVYAVQDIQSAPIGTIAAGTIGEGTQCASGWCFVDQPAGVDGWVSAAVLDNPPGQPAPAPQPNPNPNPNPGPGINFGFNFGGGGGNNNNDFDDDDDFDAAEVCFYDKINFGGKSFCVEEGDADDSLPTSWNDRISSVEVFGGATALVCRNKNFSGSCAEIDSDIRKLPASFNDRISSFEIY